MSAHSKSCMLGAPSLSAPSSAAKVDHADSPLVGVDIEPDQEWKDDLYITVERTLQPMVNHIRAAYERRLRAAAGSEAALSSVVEQYYGIMNRVRCLAKQTYQVELDRERRERMSALTRAHATHDAKKCDSTNQQAWRRDGKILADKPEPSSQDAHIGDQEALLRRLRIGPAEIPAPLESTQSGDNQLHDGVPHSADDEAFSDPSSAIPRTPPTAVSSQQHSSTSLHAKNFTKPSPFPYASRALLAAHAPSPVSGITTVHATARDLSSRKLIEERQSNILLRNVSNWGNSGGITLLSGSSSHKIQGPSKSEKTTSKIRAEPTEGGGRKDHGLQPDNLSPNLSKSRLSDVVHFPDAQDPARRSLEAPGTKLEGAELKREVLENETHERVGRGWEGQNSRSENALGQDSSMVDEEGLHRRQGGAQEARNGPSYDAPEAAKADGRKEGIELLKKLEQSLRREEGESRERLRLERLGGGQHSALGDKPLITNNEAEEVRLRQLHSRLLKEARGEITWRREDPERKKMDAIWKRKRIEQAKRKQEERQLEALRSRLEAIFQDQAQYKQILTLRGSKAQAFLDAFQMILDAPLCLEATFRRNVVVVMQRLAKEAVLYPRSYELPYVRLEATDPVAAGSYGDVYQGRFQDKPVCLKMVRLYQTSQVDDFIKRFTSEAILWAQLSHPNVLPFYGFSQYRSRPCFVSPWMRNGNVNEYLRTNPGCNRYLLISDVTKGLQYLHFYGIIHGDLKGPNILIDDSGRGLLADFGLSSVSDTSILHWTSRSTVASKGGSIRWQAPELFDLDGDKEIYNTVSSDIYAWSCVCYEVFTGKLPFWEILRDHTVMYKVRQDGIRPTRPVEGSPEWVTLGLTGDFWDVMVKCWDEDPAERPSTEALSEALAVHTREDPRLIHEAIPLPSRDRWSGIHTLLLTFTLADLDELLLDQGTSADL